MSQLSDQERQTVDKLRQIAYDLTQQGLDLSSVFLKFAQKGSETISQDEMLIAMSRVSDGAQLRDVKELHRILVGSGSTSGIEDIKVPVSDLIQILTL